MLDTELSYDEAGLGYERRDFGRLFRSLARRQARQEALVEPPPVKLASRLYAGIADHFRLRAVSWIMSANMLAFGIIILANPEVFTLPGRTMLYANLLRLATPHFWGEFCVAVGGFRLLSLAVNGTFPEFQLSPHVRALGSFLAVLFWLQIVLGALRAPDLTLALSVFPTFLALDVFSLYAAMLEVNPNGAHRGGGPA